jgi:hypothetical protein
MKKLTLFVGTIVFTAVVFAGVAPKAQAATITISDSLLAQLVQVLSALQAQVQALQTRSTAVDEDTVMDLIWKKMFHWETFFESLDGFTLSDNPPTLNPYQVIFVTKPVSGNTVYLQKYAAWQGVATLSEKSYFRTSIILPADTVAEGNYTAYITVGNSLSPTGSGFYGFKIMNNALYGVVSKNGVSAEQTVALLQGMTGRVYHLEARYYPGARVSFLVNPSVDAQAPLGEIALMGSLSSGANQTLMTMKLATDDTQQKALQVSYFEYLQRRNVLK